MASDDSHAATPRSGPPAPSDVRLVVADMDGTLLDEEGRVPASFWPVLDELGSRGILFSPASGRQFATLERLFGPAARGMAVIAENGTYVVRDGAELSSRPLPTEAVARVVAATRELTAGGADVGIVVCGKRSAYVERTDEPYLDEVRKYYALLQVVDDVTDHDDDVLKLAVFDFGDASRETAPALRTAIVGEQLVVSGAHWIDVMHADADKGTALRDLQRELGIGPAQTMVFGDYLNDLEMLGAAHWSYAMANAHPEILEAARFQAPSNAEQGVVTTIRDVLGLGSCA